MKSIFITLLFCFSVPLVYGGAFDRIGIGARTKGMGDTFIAVADDAQSIYWNPAGLGGIKNKSFTAMRRDLYNLGLINYNFFGYVHPDIGKGTIGFGWISLSTAKKVDFIDYTENTFIFSYGREFKEILRKLHLGVNIKYYKADYGPGKGSGYGLDIGAKYLMPLRKKITVGAILQDLNKPEIRWDTGSKDNLKQNLKFGVAYNFNKESNLCLDIDNILRKGKKLHLGAEYWIMKNLLGLRAGVFKPSKNKWNFTCGFSVKISKFRFDYGYEFHPELGNSHLFSLNGGI